MSPGTISFLTPLLLMIGSFSPSEHLPADDYAQLVEKYYASFQKPGFDVDALMAFYAEDVRFVDPTFGIVAIGRSEVRKLYAQIGTPETSYHEIEWTLSDVVIDGNTVVISGNWSGRFYNCPFNIAFMTMWKMRKGLIAEQRDFFAASTFDKQVAWNPETGTAECGK